MGFKQVQHVADWSLAEPQASSDHLGDGFGFVVGQRRDVGVGHPKAGLDSLVDEERDPAGTQRAVPLPSGHLAQRPEAHRILGNLQLLDLGVHDRLICRYPVLGSVVRTGRGKLATELRLGLTLILPSPRGRLCSPMVSVTNAGTPDEVVILFSEVAVTPFAWTLSFTADGRQPLAGTADVTHWLRLAPGERAPASTPLALPVATVESALPGDYAFPDTVQSRSSA